jgi:uncharacterized protein YqhQ
MVTEKKPPKRKKPKDDHQPFNYGGQAVMEGVMMRGKTVYAMAVRKPNGEIVLQEKAFTPKSDKYPILKWPIIRGVVSFIDSLSMGVRTLTQSAEIAMDGLTEPEEEPSRFERFLRDKLKLGDKLNDIAMQISVVLAVAVAVGLFMLLPTWIGSLFAPLLAGQPQWTGVIEGIVRLIIFVGYVYLVSLSKDIRRVFAYHGAEHKTINCYEAGMPLTAENIEKYSRLHKRCGTSFLLIVMIISMLVFMFVHTPNVWIRFATRIALLPVIAGLAYEVSVKWAGKRDNWLVRAVIFPGMCLQRITTAEPDTAQIETAAAALNAVLEKEQRIEPDTARNDAVSGDVLP